MSGVELAVQAFGGSGPPLIILHGLFGSGRNWTTIARGLSEQNRVVVPDLRNHGASPHADTMTYTAMADDIEALLDRAGIQRTDIIGHSMGGKAAMWLALTQPERVNRLIVVDIAPVQYAHNFKWIIQALRRLSLERLTGRTDAEDRLAQDIQESALRRFLLQNLIWRSGQGRWRINLDAIERALPELMAFPPAGGLPPFDKPVLFIAGGQSDYVAPDYASTIEQLFPKARIERLPSAGHWLHSEQPDVFLGRVRDFLH